MTFYLYYFFYRNHHPPPPPPTNQCEMMKLQISDGSALLRQFNAAPGQTVFVEIVIVDSNTQEYNFVVSAVGSYWASRLYRKQIIEEVVISELFIHISQYIIIDALSMEHCTPLNVC